MNSNKNQCAAVPQDIATRSTRNQRLQEIFWSEGSGPKGKSPAEGYGVNDIISVRCEMCGKQMMIRPHMWGHWMRRRDWTVAWMCDMCDYVPA